MRGPLNIYTVSFFGHRRIENSLAVEARLETLIRRLLAEKEYVEFLVGRDGEFDLLAASVVRRVKHTYRDDNSALVWVLPYPTAEYQNNQKAYHAYYDEVEICGESAQAHYKSAFQVRNRRMADRSDLLHREKNRRRIPCGAVCRGAGEKDHQCCRRRMTEQERHSSRLPHVGTVFCDCADLFCVL